MTDDDRQEGRRRATRRDRRAAGERSARLAKALMELSSPAYGKVELDEELRDSVDRARAVTSPIARRRAERSLAGDLRRYELEEIEASVADVQGGGAAEARLFQLAERWRERLIEEGAAAADEFPGGPGNELLTLVEKACHERATGRPRGAARALFRHVLAVLKAQAGAPQR